MNHMDFSGVASRVIRHLSYNKQCNKQSKGCPFQSQEWIISNFFLAATLESRYITSHSMEKLAFHTNTLVRDDYTIKSHYLTYTSGWSSWEIGRLCFLSLGVKGILYFNTAQRPQDTSYNKNWIKCDYHSFLWLFIWQDGERSYKRHQKVQAFVL